MLRPDLQPPDNFKTGQLVLKPASWFQRRLASFEAGLIYSMEFYTLAVCTFCRFVHIRSLPDLKRTFLLNSRVMGSAGQADFFMQRLEGK